MPHTPVVERDYLGQPALFWRHHGRIEYIYAHEHPRYVRDHHKRLTNAEAAAEYWRAVFDQDITGNPDIEAEMHTWHRFATHPHEGITP